MGELYTYFTEDEKQRFYIPKVIAKITICGALTLEVREGMDWNPPTPEQIKNLKENFNIDVELVGGTSNEP